MSQSLDEIIQSLTKKPTAMPVIDMSSKTNAKAYLSRPVEDTHTKEQLEAVHRAVRFTQQFKQVESLAKMDEEETITRPVPNYPLKDIRNDER